VPKVDFYVLSTTGAGARERFACRLVEKAVDQGCTIFVRTADDEAARELDTLLWTFHDRSFIPHELAEAAVSASPRVRVLIGSGPPGAPPAQLLVNLAAAFPSDCELFERVAEIVDAAPEGKALARERFRQYRDQGCNLETHTL
jgi:DNA polymerase-3 subunit chi